MAPTEKERIASLETDMENVKDHIIHIRRNTDKIWGKLDKQGDVRKDMNGHIKNHWKWVSIILTITAIIATVVGIVINKLL